MLSRQLCQSACHRGSNCSGESLGAATPFNGRHLLSRQLFQLGSTGGKLITANYHR